MKLKTTPFFLFVLAALAGTPRCTPRQAASDEGIKNAPSPAKVSLALNWFAEVEHAGYLAAQAEGYFKAAGLEVTVIPGGPDVPVLPRVAAGQIEFGIANADEALIARSQEVPVVALLAPIQHTPLCLLVHESSGFVKLADIRDVTLAMTPTSTYASYLRKKVPLENVTVVPYAGNVAPFLADEKYVQQGYAFSEPFVVKEKGGSARCLSAAETGFDPYTSVLVTSEKFRRENPAVVAAMTKASMRGWERYLESPAATHALIKKMNPHMNDAILAYGFDALKPLVLDETTEKEGVASMRAERWALLWSQLVEIGAVREGSVKPEDAYTAEYARQAP